jgi:hypothetical protein
MGEFEAFKDVYRNNVMHVRKSYDEHQAASVLLHVREFMDRLSAKISENTKNKLAGDLGNRPWFRRYYLTKGPFKRLKAVVCAKLPSGLSEPLGLLFISVSWLFFADRIPLTSPYTVR